MSLIMMYIQIAPKFSAMQFNCPTYLQACIDVYKDICLIACTEDAQIQQNMHQMEKNGRRRDLQPQRTI